MAASTEPSNDGITGINVTPLVDVMLVLLIIFMVTANLIDHRAIAVSLPAAKTGDEAADAAAPLRIEIARDGAVTLDGEATTLAALGPAVRARRRDASPVSIAADRAAPHGAVIDVIDQLRQNDVNDFAFAVAPGGGDATP
jgi:biopolymer transport protein ExbD